MTTWIDQFRTRPVKKLKDRVYLYLAERYEEWTGKRDPLVPPERLHFVGDGDFLETGRTFLRLFTELGGLRPDDHVLDVGCGVGRMAVGLTTYLSRKGRYDGFDIVPCGIDWCKRAITRRYRNFTFRHVDVYNHHYNPRGQLNAATFRFPYADATFTFTFLTSVFTHMLPADLENYFAEIVRTLKPGGRCFISYFLLNPESQRLIAAGASVLPIQHELPGCRVLRTDIPTAAVAFPEATIRELYRKHGLTIQEPIRYGSWCGRKDFVSYQDIVIATKQ